MLKLMRKWSTELWVKIFLLLYLIQGEPPKREFIYKMLCVYFHMFKPQSPSKHSLFDAIYLSRYFFHCSKQFLNSLILVPFRASVVFCFTSSTSAKCFLLWTSLIQENKKIVVQGEIQWTGGARGHGGHAIFGQKLLNTQHGMGGCTYKSPIMKWANVFKENLQKNIHWSWMQPLTTPAGTLIQMGS